MSCHDLLQGIFLTQVKPRFPALENCKQILYHLSLQGNPGKQSLQMFLTSQFHLRIWVGDLALRL